MCILAFIAPGIPELLIFLAIVLLIFGKRLPSAMYSVGKSITEFKKGVSEGVPPSEDDKEIGDKSESTEKGAD